MRLRRKQPAPEMVRRRSLASRQAPPSAFSYYTQRSERRENTGRGQLPETPAASKGLMQVVLQRFGLVVLLIVIMGALINGLSLSTDPRVIPVVSVDSRVFLHTTQAYQQGAQEILAGSVWNRSKLTINTDSVAQKMKQEFPELDQVSLALPFLGHRPLIYVQPSQPALLLSSTSGAYVVDEHGKALLATTHLPATVKLDLPLVSDQSGVAVHEGQQVLTSDSVAFIQAVVQQLKAHNTAIDSLTLPPAASELDVRLSGQSFYIKFNLHASKDDARQQAGTFIAVWKKLQSQHITPAHYIDVRVDGRAYYL